MGFLGVCSVTESPILFIKKKNKKTRWVRSSVMKQCAAPSAVLGGGSELCAVKLLLRVVGCFVVAC